MKASGTFYTMLPVPIGTDRKEELMQEAIKAKHKLDRFEELKKKVAKRMTEKIDKAETEFNQLLRKVEKGMEDQDVECKWFYDEPRKDEKTLVRLDSDASVRVEGMTEGDRNFADQEDMFEEKTSG